MAGGHSVTLPPDILEQLIRHPLTDQSVAGFMADWDSVYSAGTTTIDLLGR